MEAPCWVVSNSETLRDRSRDAPAGRGSTEGAGDDWAALAVRFEAASAEEVIAWAVQRFGNGLALSTSLQAGGMVVLDLLHRLGAQPRVLTLDTGRLPQETYDHIDRVRQHYGVEVEIQFPDAAEVQQLVRLGGPNLFYRSPEDRRECCRVRKVEPLRRALEPFDAWLSGLRRGQSAARAGTPKVERDRALDPRGRRVKVNPLADWSEERLWDYIRGHGVPYHPLYDQGYLSIGCAPCTRPARPAEGPRAGRWPWEAGGSRECGLHVVTSEVVGEAPGRIAP